MTENTAWADATIGTFEFRQGLAEAGLGHYEGRLREYGFLDWSSAVGILESDMAEMVIKLGDRRKLQRMIREYITTNPPKPGAINRPPQERKRKRPYHRHPRPDPNAPIKPKTAYVLFGEHVRKNPVVHGLSFADLVKEIGKRWQALSDEEKTLVWEEPAAGNLRGYRAQLDQYKQTEKYHQYQEYLEDFKQSQRDSDQVDSSGRSTSSPARDPNLSGNTPSERADHPGVYVPQLLEQFDTSRQEPDGEFVEHMDVDKQGDKPVKPPVQKPSDSVKIGMEEVHRILKAFGINPHLVRVTAFPQEFTTTQSVETFLRCTGALVYLWDHDQALHQVRTLYHSPNVSTPADALEVFAMASVGSYCDGHPAVQPYAEKFLDYFIYMLSSPLAIQDLARMRLFACLALCRFTSSAESARTLLLSALNIGRETFTSESSKKATTDEEMRHWWNVFRSIVFLESWFAYNTYQESRITFEDLNLCHPPQSLDHKLLDASHERIFELGWQASYVALDLKSSVERPIAVHARQYLDSLSQWHRRLPPPVQLSRISTADAVNLDWHTKRSVLQLHILFLGLFIEPYRICLIALGKFHLGEKMQSKEDMETLVHVEDQCIAAARQSARVASLLQYDHLVRAQCWVLLYTSFVGGTVLLYSATQGLLRGTSQDIGLELTYASSHIGVLAMCSYENESARKMYTSLQILFNDVRDVLASPDQGPMFDIQPDPIVDRKRNVVDIAKRAMSLMENSVRF